MRIHIKKNLNLTIRLYIFIKNYGIMKAFIIQYFLLFLMIDQGIGQQFNLEASLTMQQINGDYSHLEQDELVSIEISDFISYGAQFGLNMKKLNLGIDFLFGSTKVISENNFDAKVSLFDANLEYSILNKSLTPILVTGIGSVTYTDSFTSVETLNESDFSLNAGAGFKWIIVDRFFVKSSYKVISSKIEGTTEKLAFHGFNISLGYIFTPKMLTSK